MPNVVPPLAFFCVTALARVPDQLHHFHSRRVPVIPALLNAFPRQPDLCLWAALAQLVHPLPPELHDYDLPLSHPDLHLLQTIPHSPDFALVTLVSLPNCVHLRDDDVANLRTLHSLLALDLRGCSISSYAFTALTRGLARSSDGRRSGPWGLRLLSLHGCPNIDNDVLSVLHKFPLISAVDLRFTRCTPSAVNAHLSSLGFSSSSNKSLFHPASLSLALCSLEKIAHTTSVPISLYSCPSQSVFRLHVDQPSHLMPHSNKAVSVDAGSSIPPTAIRTTTSAEDTVVFIPPLQGSARDASSSLSKSSDSDSASVVSPLIGRSTSPEPVSNVSSFYEDAPARNRRILPLSAQAVQSSKGSKLDQLAIARPPPPWKILDTQRSPELPKPDAVACPQNTLSDNIENSRQKQSDSNGKGQALDNPLKVDRARIRKRGSDSVSDMGHSSKRIKIESEFALAKRRDNQSVKPRNPFVRNIRSVFAESSTGCPDKPPATASGPPHETGSGMQLRTTRSLPSKPGGTETTKPLTPITKIKPPILPKEFLPSFPHAQRPKRKLKQTRLPFSRGEEEEEGSEEDVVFDWGS